MNNFIFQNSTKVYFGKGCVKEYLACLTKGYGDTVMLCYGGGSIKKRYLREYEGCRLAKENSAV